MTTLLKFAAGRQILVLLLVIALASGAAGLIPFGSGPLGPEAVSADSRCDEHYYHTHGAGWWMRTDAYSGGGYGLGPHGYVTQWADHENSVRDWCSS